MSDDVRATIDASVDVDSTSAPAPEPPPKPSHIIGLGASAGGLESLERFFGAFPHNSGMALVVIQHLAPDHKSLMSELLGKHTQLPVSPAMHGSPVEPDHVYLIPPGHNVEVRECRLVLTQRMDHPHRRPNYAVDQFFRSLALDYAERAVGVVLSGTGSDGAHGAATIKAAGGFVLAENPETAKFGSMPRSAIDTGSVSAVRDAAQLPAEILRHAGLLGAEALQPKEGLDKILSLVSGHSGIDFVAYKRATVGRRVEMRRVSSDCDSLEAYAALLESSPAERTLLSRDLLVGVTAFFRDKEVFEALPHRLEPLVAEAAKRRDRTLRVWVAACSTGEEAYSLGIICHECIRRMGVNVDVKMFATDVNEQSLAVAGRGRYPFSATSVIEPELLQRYFLSHPDAYEARPFLRESVVFARHDILRDPPFTRVDLLSCRNMLIYFALDAQRRTRNVFHFALRPGGLLVLGSSETLGPEEPGFTPLDEPRHLYQMTGEPAPAHSVVAGLQVADLPRELPISRSGRRQPAVDESQEPGTRLLEATLEWLAKPALVVNRYGGLMYSFGKAADQLRVPTGRAGWQVADLLPPEMSVVISSAIERAMESTEEVVVGLVPMADPAQTADVRVVPLGSRSSPDRGAVVVFEALGEDGPETSGTAPRVSVDEAVRTRIRQLEQELRRTRAKLTTTVEELEASNEELQATNEELVSSNEELQSTNEELQSLNEELHTVNAELQAKVEELSVLSADLGNLLRTMGAGLLFLDVAGRVRRYNETLFEVVPLVPHDVGRPIGDIAHQLKDTDLGVDIDHVVRTGVGIEREVSANNGRVYSLVMHPFESATGAIEGVVVTLNDVTKAHAARDRLQVYSRLVEQSPSPSVIADAFGNIEYANPAYSHATGLRSGELRGRDLRTTLSDRTSVQNGRALRHALDHGASWSGEAWLKTASSGALRVHTSVYPVRRTDGKVSHIVKIAELAELAGPEHHSAEAHSPETHAAKNHSEKARSAETA